MAKATAKKRKVIVESTGEAHISATFNNIIISLTNKKGEVISWSSAGKMGFRGSKKNTPYAAQMAAEDASKVALEAGLKKVLVAVKKLQLQNNLQFLFRLLIVLHRIHSNQIQIYIFHTVVAAKQVSYFLCC